jgi:L-malate glycosyltransferase
MNREPARLCFIGNMLGKNADYPIGQGQVVGDLLASEGYEVTCVSSKINRAARMIEIAATLIVGHRKFDAVVLEVYSGLYFLVADIVSLICKVLAIPLIAVLHGGQLAEFGRRFPGWTTRVFNRTNAMVAPSHFLAKEIGTLGYQVQVIPNVIDLDLYPYRERHKILPNLIWMRSFHAIYNPEMAIKVLAKLRETKPAATLTMAGSDKGLEDNIKSLAQQTGVSDAVRFVGFLDLESKLKELSAGDIYLNTNRVDNMPVSVVEARALGLPVVATNIGGLPYMIENGMNGFLVPSEDVDMMTEKIKTLLDCPELTLKISRSGRALAEQSGWKSVRPVWEQLITEVVEAKRLKRLDP